MADAVTSFTTLSTDAPNVYIGRQMYSLAERKLVLGRFARKDQMPQRMGKTLRLIRYKRMALPTAKLIEGTPPDAVALATENTDIVVEQWGIVSLLTDVAQITTVHPALQIAIDRTGLAMAEVIEREIAIVLMGGTNVSYVGAATARSGIAAADKLNTATVLKATSALRSRGANEVENGLYGGVVSPQQEADILGSDTTFQNATQLARVQKMEAGEVGSWMGVRWFRSNFLPIFEGVATPDAAAADAKKTQLAGAAGGSWTANATVKVTVVARDANNDYERRISQEAAFALGAGNTRLTVTLPTSTAYVYDIYVSDAAGGAGTARLKLSRQVTGTAINIDTAAATTAATPPAAPASGREVFVSWVFGDDAFGRVELNGMSLQAFITPAGSSYTDPLAQGRKVGSKIMWKSYVLDNDFFQRVETASGFSANLPA